MDLISAGRTGAVHSALRSSTKRRIAPSGAARYFGRDYLAKRLASTNQLNRPVANLLFQPQQLLATTAFTAPSRFYSVAQGGIRDTMSAWDRSDQARYTAGHGGDQPVQRQSQAALLESRLDLMRERLLQEAWDWFKQGEYSRARSAFKSAEMLNRELPEPRAGMFFCSVAQQRYSQAIHDVQRIYRWDADEELFNADYRIAEHYESAERLNRDLRGLSDYVELSPTGSTLNLDQVAEGVSLDREALAGATAALSYAMWHGARGNARLEALRAARAVERIDPGGEFAGFAERLEQAVNAAETVESAEPR